MESLQAALWLSLGLGSVSAMVYLIGWLMSLVPKRVWELMDRGAKLLGIALVFGLLTMLILPHLTPFVVGIVIIICTLTEKA